LVSPQITASIQELVPKLGQKGIPPLMPNRVEAQTPVLDLAKGTIQPGQRRIEQPLGEHRLLAQAETTHAVVLLMAVRPTGLLNSFLQVIHHM
jgi:hypothetical protein